MEYKKLCAACGSIFYSMNYSQVCCSSKCGLKLGGGRKKYYVCQYCGEQFWKPDAFRKKYCSKQCELAARHDKAVERKKNLPPVATPTVYHRECLWCGEKFETTYPNKIYCSQKCGCEGNKRLQREKWAEDFVPQIITCKECASIFTTKIGSPKSSFCCQSCAAKYNRRIEHQTQRHHEYLKHYKSKRKAQIQENYIEDVPFDAIYKRDNGICQICGLHVPYDKQADDSWNATIDHVVPLSKGGEHSRANCQLAHRICNSIKCDTELVFTINWELKAQENNYWRLKYQQGLKVIYEHKNDPGTGEPLPNLRTFDYF